jgi:hypothetical protein
MDQVVTYPVEFRVLNEEDDTWRTTGRLLAPPEAEYDRLGAEEYERRSVWLPTPEEMDDKVRGWLDGHARVEFRPSELVREVFGEENLRYVDEQGNPHYVIAVRESLERLRDAGEGWLVDMGR